MRSKPATELSRLLGAGGPEPSGDLGDAELLERFIASRDQAAFELLIWRHGRMVWNVCRRLLSRVQDIEDGYQATFLLLAREAHRILRRDAVGSWLYKVAYRTALHIRAQGRRARGVADPVPAAAPAAAESFADEELGALLDEELNQLPDAFRAVLVLCYLDGMSVAAAARELRCPRGTVMSRLARGKARLRARLARRGVHGPAALALVGTGAARLLAAARPPVAAVMNLVFSLHPPGAGRAAAVAAIAKGVLPMIAGHSLRNTIAALAILALGAGLAWAGAAWPTGPDAAPGGLPTFAAALAPDPAPPAVHHADWKEIASYKGQSRGTSQIAFSADGKYLVVAGEERSVRVYDRTTDKEHLALTIDKGSRSFAFFDPDKPQLVTLSSDGTLQRWDLQTGKEKGSLTLKAEGNNAGLIVVAAHGKRLFASVSNPRTPQTNALIHEWDLQKGELSNFLGSHLFVGPRDVAIAPDGKRLASVGIATTTTKLPDGQVTVAQVADLKVWDLKQNVEAWSISEGAGQTVAFSSDSQRLAFDSYDRKTKRWNVQIHDAAKQKRLATLAGHDSPETRSDGMILSLAFSPDNQFLASAGMDRTIKIWRVADGECLVTLKGHKELIYRVAFAPDGRSLASTSRDGTVRIWGKAKE